MSDTVMPIVDTVAPVTETADPAVDTKAQEAAKDAAGLAALRTKLGLKAPAESAKPEAKTEPAKPEVPNEYAQQLAHLAKMDREFKAAKARHEAELKTEREKLEARARELETVMARGGKLASALEKFKAGQRSAAAIEVIRETFGESLSIEDIADMTQSLGEEAPASLTPEQIERQFKELRAKELEDGLQVTHRERVRCGDVAHFAPCLVVHGFDHREHGLIEDLQPLELEKKAAEKAEADRVEARAQAEARILKGFETHLMENVEKYPTVNFRGVSAARVKELLKEGVAATGKIPDAALVFEFLEQEFRAAAEQELPFAKPAPAPVEEPQRRPLRTFGRADLRGVTHTDDGAPKEPVKRMTLAEKKAEFKRTRLANL